MTGLSGGRRLQVVHSTRYHYDHTVPASYNEARLLPRTDARQQVLETNLTVTPLTWRYDYVDYWGTSVTAFEARTPHTELVVVGTTVTDVIDAGECPQVDWDRLRSDRTQDAFSETLVSTKLSAAPPELSLHALDAAGDSPPHVAAQAVCGMIGAAMEYAPGSTGVQTVAIEAWDDRRGVCQDFAHLALGALRSIGIPARYVSGYAAPRTGAEVGEPTAGESHAWVEWWTGGWYGWDPTNDRPAGSRHVALGRGRDYSDVAPLRGIVAGGGRSSLDVSVIVTMLR